MADGFTDFPIFLISLVAGGAVIASLYISKLVRRVTIPITSNADVTEQSKISISNFSKKSSSQSQLNKSSNKKKYVDKNIREGKQSFYHHWLLTSLKGHSSAILDMEFSPNGKLLATCGEDRAILLWNTKDWHEKNHKNVRVNVQYDYASLIRWSPDSKAFIIKRHKENVIEAYKITRSNGSIGSIAKVITYPTTIAGDGLQGNEKGLIQKVQELYLKDTRRRMRIYEKGPKHQLACEGKKEPLYNVFGLKLDCCGSPKSTCHSGDIIGLGLSSNGKFIMSSSNKTDIVITDLKGTVLHRLDTSLSTNYSTCLSPCGKYIIASGFARDAKVWEVQFTKSGDFASANRLYDLKGHSSGIYHTSFDAASSNVGTLSKDGTWKLFNVAVDHKKGEEPQLLATGEFTPEEVNRIALSPTGNVVAVSSGATLNLYDAKTAKLDISINDIFSGSITCLLFDSEGKYVLVSGDRHVRVFHNVTGMKVAAETARAKLKQPNNSSALTERLKQQISTAEAFVASHSA